ncbi:MAG: hypothetical protein JNL58_00130 [Planctomyces sp.]|nr:hypothetical protein [Planctomyces sp.]
MVQVVRCSVCSRRVVLMAGGICPGCQTTNTEPDIIEDVEESDSQFVPQSEAPAFPEIPDTSIWSVEESPGEFVYEIPPRQIPERFKKKTFMSHLLPRSASEKLAVFIGYGVGGIFFVLGGLYFIGGLARVVRSPGIGVLSLFGIGAYFISMARRKG